MAFITQVCVCVCEQFKHIPLFLEWVPCSSSSSSCCCCAAVVVIVVVVLLLLVVVVVVVGTFITQVCVCVCEQFKHIPLYLEWAPVDVFQSPATEPINSKHSGTHSDKVCLCISH